jgi:RNA polymerase sigma-70 factor (ECF subfamily)
MAAVNRPGPAAVPPLGLRRQEADRRTPAPVYCLVSDAPSRAQQRALRELAGAHPDIEQVMERRSADRRRATERRSNPRVAPDQGGRRMILSAGGRRMGERRAPLVPVLAPALRRGARRIPAGVEFVTRVEPPARSLEDAETARLIARLQSGERDAFDDIYRAHVDRVYRYLRVLLRDRHEAEDATQEVFVSAFRSLPAYEIRGAPFRAWLFRVARNEALNRAAKNTRLEVVDPADVTRRIDGATNGSEIDVPAWVSDQDLFALIERLGVHQRQVLLLRYMVGLSVAEAARVLDSTPDAVYRVQRRALAVLHDRLTALGRKPAASASAYSMRRTHGAAPVLLARRWAIAYRSGSHAHAFSPAA